MREILFRGKRIDNGEWLYGYFGVEDNKPLIAINKENGINGYFVYPDTVGQFTGLTANGKKIFEGDIVMTTGLYPIKQGKKIIWVKERKGEVYYYNGAFYYGKYMLSKASRITIKIIGNIHDNPELLEVE